MAQQDELALSREAWDALNAHDVDRFLEFFALDVEYHSAPLPQPIQGREAVGEIFRSYLRGFPDLRFRGDISIDQQQRGRASLTTERTGC